MQTILTKETDFPLHLTDPFSVPQSGLRHDGEMNKTMKLGGFNFLCKADQINDDSISDTIKSRENAPNEANLNGYVSYMFSVHVRWFPPGNGRRRSRVFASNRVSADNNCTLHKLNFI